MTDTVSTYILLDRSGSMGGAKWNTAIDSINQYIDTLRTGDIDATVTVAAFDSPSNFTGRSFISSWNGIPPASSPGITPATMAPNPTMYMNPAHSFGIGPTQAVATTTLDYVVLRDTVNLKELKALNSGELFPRGGTPLYDATAKIIQAAEANNNDKTVIIIMTDGEENTSVEFNALTIKARIEACTARGWEVIFLGSEFNADSTVSAVGVNLSKSINTNLRNQSASMSFYATSTLNYAKTGEAIDTTQIRSDLGDK